MESRKDVAPKLGDWALVVWLTSNHQPREMVLRVWQVDHQRRTINNGRWHWRQIVELREKPHDD